MKKKTQTKVVKAWAIILKRNNHLLLTSFTKKSAWERVIEGTTDYGKRELRRNLIAVPCTITYTLPKP